MKRRGIRVRVHVFGWRCSSLMMGTTKREEGEKDGGKGR